jgi:hypothetical protein
MSGHTPPASPLPIVHRPWSYCPIVPSSDFGLAVQAISCQAIAGPCPPFRVCLRETRCSRSGIRASRPGRARRRRATFRASHESIPFDLMLPLLNNSHHFTRSLAPEPMLETPHRKRETRNRKQEASAPSCRCVVVVEDPCPQSLVSRPSNYTPSSSLSSAQAQIPTQKDGMTSYLWDVTDITT